MDPYRLIAEVAPVGTPLYELLVRHGEAVASKAVALARRYGGDVDEDLVWEGAMLHDIGIVEVDAPQLHCHGSRPYLAHGIVGRRMLEDMGLFPHALICERHVGVGLTADEILEAKLPLPPRNMVPETPEQILVCYADKFFSKGGPRLDEELPPDRVRAKIATWSRRSLETFDAWHARFSGETPQS